MKLYRVGTGIGEREYLAPPEESVSFREKVEGVRSAASALVPLNEEDIPADMIERVELAKEIVACSERILCSIDDADGDQGRLGHMAFELGSLWEQLVIRCGWEAHALRGKRTTDAAKLGGKIRANELGWKARASDLQSAIDKKHKDRPELSYERLKEFVAKEFGCSKKTVDRYTVKPHHQKA